LLIKASEKFLTVKLVHSTRFLTQSYIVFVITAG